MHGNRRRKKRPSYGVRTVEITKGQNGFGFTISGQEPCILSCIVSGSPAEKAGLRPGDYLIAVNGQNVSKTPHDYVVRLIGLSKLLKLQIAENYYSDSSDDEFTVNRPKPKYPNRLRHKHHQTRAEKVVRDLQSGAIFGEHAALHHSENAPLSDRDWPDAYPPKEPYASTSVPTTLNNNAGHSPTAPSASPTRLRPDQIRLVMAEARQAAARTSRPTREEAPLHPHRVRQTPKKRETPPPKTKSHSPSQQIQEDISLSNQDPSYSFQQLNNTRQYQHSFQNMRALQHNPTQSRQYQDLNSEPSFSYQQGIQLQQQQHQDNLKALKSYQLQPISHFTQQLQHKQLTQHLNKQISINQTQQGQHIQSYIPSNDAYNVITEQDINNLLYPTLAELQKVPPEEMGETVYRAVVGYLGTIEMPKEPQGGSRLTAIRNCIRRLRIEKKVHTLVLMSIFPEQVVLTNPHGLMLAEYPAERITFCGVYADDKKFFGLVTIHGMSSDELSDGSQDEAGESGASLSSSCHVFMVDPNSVQHSGHAKRAKNFRIDCTPAPDEASAQCLEFPDSADPILHAIMSLYRNRVGFHLYTRAPGLIDVDAQMSPQHSNTSSNSSNSDSGIGFRDEGGHHYHHTDRIFVVEFDDNHRTRLQNIQLVSNLRGNGELCRSNMEYLRANLRANMNVSLANNINVMTSEASDSSLTPAPCRGNLNKIRKHNHIIDKANNNMPSCSRARPSINNNNIMNLNSNTTNIRNTLNDSSRTNCINKAEKENVNANNLRVNVTDNEKAEFDSNLRVSVSDTKKIKELRNSLAEGRLSLTDGRTSITDELRTTPFEERRSPQNDGRTSITKEILEPLAVNNTTVDRSLNRTPARECISPQEGDRLTVRAMPDPVTFERSPALVGSEPPVHVASIRHSMHKYLQHKQEHLVKESQKINRRESDSGTHPLSVRAFSPSTTKHSSSTPVPKGAAPLPPVGGVPSSMSSAMDLSLKLSPKVYGLPYRPSAPSERSFTRSLEDLRDSSTSEGICGGGVYTGMPFPTPSGTGNSFRGDGSESDHGGFDRFRNVSLARLLHASETNLSRCDSSINGAHEQPPRGAFRAVPPRSHRANPVDPRLVPRIGPPHMEPMPDPLRGIPYLGEIGGLRRPFDSCDENTETTENTGGQGGSQDVHPPTQDEFSHDSDSEQIEGRDGKKSRGVSLRRFGRTRHQSERPANTSDSNATHSDTDAAAKDQVLSTGAAASWALSFEKLLDDPAGLHTFAEFLKKEYSHENIYFWTACERYKLITNNEERQRAVRLIFNRHLAEGAPEPVNVDAHARQMAQGGLANADKFVFSSAQKQIFNLMKFDSYTRFLKSDLYNNCLSQERKGFPLPYPGDESLDPDLRIAFEDSFSKHLKKSKSDAEDRRRKSLLPWSRKDRSKSRDRGETEYRRRKKLGHRAPSETSSVRSDLSDSHTSLNSSDFVLGRRAVSKESLSSSEAISLNGNECFNLCRVSLPDQSNSVLAVRSGETVKEIIRPLLEKRRINFSTFNVLLGKSDKIIDLNSDSTVLGGHEARIERMVLFSLFLPSRKTVYVKAKPYKLISEVLKPILNKYGYKLELMLIIKSSDSKIMNMKSLVTELDGEKFLVHTKDEIKEYLDPNRYKKRSNSLDEITNRVFDDVLTGKTQPTFDDLGVLDFDARSTKTEGGGSDASERYGSLDRRTSLQSEKELGHNQPINLGGKMRPHTALNVSRTENELYEDLKRVQSRIEDQRGTEINFELPEFLKSDQNANKENNRHLADQLLAHLDRSFKADSIEDEFFSRTHPEVWGGAFSPQPVSNGSPDATLIAPPDLDLDDLEETLKASPGDGLDDPLEDKRDTSHPSSSKSPFVKDPLTLNLDSNGVTSTFPPQRSRMASPAAFLSPPPPPLPPKPKLRGLARGPPPRPPSRQLQPLHSRIEDSIRQPSPVPSLPPRHTIDKFSVSFV